MTRHSEELAPPPAPPSAPARRPPTAATPVATPAAPRRWATWAFVAVAVVAAALQTRLALRPGLWVDEVFSLAVATGHSIEHPAADARPALGDFADRPAAGPPATIAAHAAHDREPAGAGRVVRAAFLSDTSPPLYYLLLSGWTRIAGTSDAALRLFSAACALLALPLVWLVARRVGDRETALTASVLFAFAPPVLYFGTEGRMYALTWLFTLSLAWLALRMEQDGARTPLLAAWAVVGAAGLLTHYFIAFVWAAAALWLWLRPDRVSRTRLVAAAAGTGLLVLPWFLRVPESLGRWRVTGGWLDGELTARQMVTGPLLLVKYMVFWGAPYRDKGELLAIGLFALLGLAMLLRGPRRWVTGRPQLLCLWLLGSALGPLAFDLALGTTSSQINRYGLPGLPAALILVAVGVGALPRVARAAFVLLLIAAWGPGLRDVFAAEPRPFHPFPRIAARLDAWHQGAAAASSDLVVVHSIPTGSIGLARYLRSGLPMASWTVRQPWRRTRADLDALVAGRCRVVLVKIHDLGEPWPAEAWLRERATLTARERMGAADVMYFALRGPSPGGGPPPGCPADPAAGSARGAQRGAAAARPVRRSTTQPATRSTGA